jgi:hypothetical protein
MLNIFWVELGFALIVLCALPWYCTSQGLGTHLKANTTHAFCFDSRPNSSYRMEFFLRNHLVAGFANSNRRKLCNAKFMTINDEVFLVAIKPVQKGEEVFVYYKIR